MTELQKAKQKYQDSLRNYNYYKNRYEDFYCNPETKESKSNIRDIETRLNHSYDLCETLTYIFGHKVRN